MRSKEDNTVRYSTRTAFDSEKAVRRPLIQKHSKRYTRYNRRTNIYSLYTFSKCIKKGYVQVYSDI